MNTMSTQKTNSHKKPTNQRYLEQPNIVAPMLFHRRTSRFSPFSCTFHHGKEDSWFLQCVIRTLHHRPMFSTNCMWVCVCICHVHIYICLLDCLCENLQEWVCASKPNRQKINTNPKIILFKVVYDNFW